MKHIVTNFVIALVVAIIALANVSPAAAAPAKDFWTVGNVAACTVAGSRATCFTLRQFVNSKEVATFAASTAATVGKRTLTAAAVTGVTLPGFGGHGSLTQAGVVYKWGR